MPEYKYLIVGGGMAADAAVLGIRKADKSGTIGVLAGEAHAPYKRPPLSKALWKGDPVESVRLPNAAEHARIHSGRKAARVLPGEKQVIDADGTAYGYGKLLLATGGKVRTLPGGAEGVIYYRTLDDYQALRARAEKGKTAAVIGGGFIGSEIAAALALNGVKVTMVFPDAGIGGRVYPPRLAQFLNGYYREKGVEVRPKEHVAGVVRKGTGFLVKTQGGDEFAADAVVAGIGIVPETDLAKAAGLEVGDGILVDEFLQTSQPGIFAAGDVANFFNPVLGKRMRVEHEDNANTMGEYAGANMAGDRQPYHHLPFFYSDLFDLGYEAVGDLDARLQVVEDWKEEFREGVIYYLGEGRVRGVLLWNTWGQLDNARALLSEKGPFEPGDLKGRLPR